MSTPPFTLVHADPRFYVVAKAAGIGFHREGDTPGLMDHLREGLADTALWPVHRLDLVTSGLIVVARSAAVAAALGAAFAAHEVEKTYLALSDRKPKKKQGWIRGDMVKARGGAWRLTHTLEAPAVTHFDSASLAPGVRLFMLYPQTGRTHQLRVALKSVSAPILGDALYGGSPADRVYLHAYRLAFRLDGEAFAFTSPPSGGLFDTPALADVLAREGAG